MNINQHKISFPTMYNMTIFEQFNFLSHYDVIPEMRSQQGGWWSFHSWQQGDFQSSEPYLSESNEKSLTRCKNCCAGVMDLSICMVVEISNSGWLGHFCFKESQFQPFPLGLDMYFIWNPNKKLHIPVKMSYETSLYGMPFSRYQNLAESALFCKI